MSSVNFTDKMIIFAPVEAFMSIDTKNMEVILLLLIFILQPWIKPKLFASYRWTKLWN